MTLIIVVSIAQTAAQQKKTLMPEQMKPYKYQQAEVILVMWYQSLQDNVSIPLPRMHFS